MPNKIDEPVEVSLEESAGLAPANKSPVDISQDELMEVPLEVSAGLTLMPSPKTESILPTPPITPLTPQEFVQSDESWLKKNFGLRSWMAPLGASWNVLKNLPEATAEFERQTVIGVPSVLAGAARVLADPLLHPIKYLNPKNQGIASTWKDIKENFATWSEPTGMFLERNLIPSGATPEVSLAVSSLANSPINAAVQFNDDAQKLPIVKNNPTLQSSLEIVSYVLAAWGMGEMYGGKTTRSVTKKALGLLDKSITAAEAGDTFGLQSSLNEINNLKKEIPSEVIKKVEAAKLEIDKQKFALDPDYFPKWISEDLGSTSRKISDIKQPRVELPKKAIIDESINRAMDRIKIKKRKIVAPEEIANELGLIYNGPQEGIGHMWTDPISKSSFTTRTLKLDEIVKETEINKAKYSEPITEIDRLAEERIPELDNTETNPLRETPEKTVLIREQLKGRKISDTPEMMFQKLKSDVNAWLDGDNTIDINKTRDDISTLTTEADRYDMGINSAGDSYFPDPESFGKWKDSMNELADWARKAERPGELRQKFERSPDIKIDENIASIEKDFGKPIDSLTDSEIEEWFMKKFGKEPAESEVKAVETIKEEPIISEAEIKHKGFFELPPKERAAEIAKPKLEDINGISREKIVRRILNGDYTVLTDIEKGVSKHGRPQVTDAIVNEAMKQIHREKNTTKQMKMQDNYSIMKGEIDKVLRGEKYDIPKVRENILITKIKRIFSRPKSAAEPRQAERPDINLDKLNPDQRKLVENALAFDKAVKLGDWIKKFDIKHFIDRLGFHTYRAIHEKAGMIRNTLVKRYGEDGWKLIQLMDSEAGGSGYGQLRYERMIKEVYSGMSKKEAELVNAYNLSERLNDIFRYKSDVEYKAPKGMNRYQSAMYKELFQQIHGLTDSQFTKIKKASDTIFQHHKMWIDDMVKSGLKSTEEGELLKSHNYRKLRNISVEDMYDDRYRVKVGEKIVRQTDSGVDPLGKGSVNVLEGDARIVANEVANRVYRRIANNDAKTAWWEFAEKHPNNPFVWVKSLEDATGKPIPKPESWVRDYRYIDGEKRVMYFHPDVARQIMSAGGDISYRLGRVLGMAVGTPLVRFLAVGSSAAWASTAGLLMDITHTFFAPRIYESGYKGLTSNYVKIYSPVSPVFIMQLGKNMASTFYDAVHRGPKYEIYEKYGGSMPFLTQRESHFLGRGVQLPGINAKILDAMSYHGKSMELWNRLSIMERTLEYRAKQMGITLDEAYKNPDLCREAVHVARERMPYAQGGWLVKALDRVLPFTNASYVGARTMWRSAYENPIDFAARMTNIGIGAAGITMASWLLAPHVERDIPDQVRNRNATIPLFPNTMSFTDEEGNVRYFYLKIPLDPGVSFIYNLFRGLTHKMMYDTGMIKNEPNYEAIIGSLKNQLPTQTVLPPNLEAFVNYASNYSVWQDRTIFTGAGGATFSWPRSRFEGIIDANVPQTAKTIGSLTGLSPKRLTEAVSQVMPTGNEYIWAMGKAYEVAFNDVDSRLMNQHWALTLSQIPGVRRIIGITLPRVYRQAGREELKQEDALNVYIRNGTLDGLVEGYYWHGVGNESDIDKYIDSFEDKTIRTSMISKIKFVEIIKELPNRRSWSSMFHANPEVKAQDYYDIYKTLSIDEKMQLEKELDVLDEAGYTSKRFYDKLDDLIAGQ